MTCSLEEAEALGFSSIADAERHEAWSKALQERFKQERSYQGTAEARERKLQAGVPANAWVELPSAYAGAGQALSSIDGQRNGGDAGSSNLGNQAGKHRL